MGVTLIKNQPVTLGYVDPNSDCYGYDEKYCQMVEQSDDFAFQFLASECGGNIVTCGDFNTQVCTTLNWFSSDLNGAISGWSRVGTQMNHIVGSTNNLQQNGIFTLELYYKITISVKRVVSQLNEINGSVVVKCGTTQSATITAAGDYTFYLYCAGSTNLYITPSSDFDGAIDDVSSTLVNVDYRVFLSDIETNTATGTAISKQTIIDNIVYFNASWSDFGVSDGCYYLCLADGSEVGGCSDEEPFSDLVKNGAFVNSSNWTLGTNWSISAGVATHTSGASGTMSQTMQGMTAGLCYKLNFVVTGRSAGTLLITLGGTVVDTISTNSSFQYTGVIPVNTNGLLEFAASSAFNGSIDNVTLILELSCYPKSACSPCYSLKSEHSCTKVLSWTNNDNAFGLIYDVPLPYSTFTHYLRVFASFERLKFQNEKEQFRDSAGNRLMLHYSSDEQFDLRFDYLPIYLHRAIAIGIGHDSFYVDGQKYAVTSTDYSPEWRDRKKVAQSEITVVLSPEKKENFNCT